MKSRLLVSVAAATLAVGTAFVMAQPADKGGKGGQAPATQAPDAQPGGQKEGQPKTTQPKEDTKQPKAKEKAAEPKAKNGGPKDTQAQPGRDPDPKDKPKAKEKATTDKPTQKGQEKATTDKPAAKDKATTDAPPTKGKAAGGKDAVQITTQQRTEIRQTIIQQGDAPRVTNVNFNISVGTEVPSTVRVVVLPARVVEIYPQWRGYRYFIVGERIIIVEPDRLVIVFIIEA